MIGAEVDVGRIAQRIRGAGRCVGRWLGAAALGTTPAATAPAEDGAAAARERMVVEQVEARGVSDRRVLDALRKVPRHAFVPEPLRPHAYEDRPLPIGHGQTISQPYIVAIMSQLARVGPRGRVLEVGTGSGYQAAVLGELAADVRSIEIVAPLAARAAETLSALGYRNVHVRRGDGHAGWPEHAPFDAILVTAAPARVPPALLEQLAVGGRLVIPVGEGVQTLEVHTRSERGIEVEEVLGVRFVPMTGGDGG